MKNNKKIILVLTATLLLCGIAAGAVFVIMTMKSDKISQESLETYQQAKKKYLERNLEDAVDLLEKVVRENRKFTNAYFMLGKAYFFNGQYEKARSAWERGLKTNAHHNTTKVWLGILYSKEKKSETKAVMLFLEVLEDDSMNIQANYNLGKIFFNRKEYRKAIYYFNNALENELHLSEIHYDFARIYVELDMKERAMSEINKAIKLGGSPSLQENIESLLSEITSMENE